MADKLPRYIFCFYFVAWGLVPHKIRQNPPFRITAGLDVRLKRAVGIYSKPDEGALAITFEGEISGGDLKQATNETSACGYFPFDHLPEPIRSHLRQRVEDFQPNVPYAVFRTQ